MAQDTFEIKIDREHFKVTGTVITGAELRQLPSPPIGPERDLYLRGRGHEEDRKIDDGTSVPLEHGLVFFTTPATINPGGDAAP